jgi:hypothetical protein
MFKAELEKGSVQIHGLEGHTGSYPDEAAVADSEAEPPSASDSSHEDDVQDSQPLRSSTDGSGPEPPKEPTQETDFSGEQAYDNDADDGDAGDYLQGTPSNQTEALTMQDEEQLGVTPAPLPDDGSTQQVDLPFVVYPGYAKLEKQKLEKRRLAKQKHEQQKLEQEKPEKHTEARQNQTVQRPSVPQPSQVRSPQLVRSLTGTGTSHMVKAATSGAALPTARPQAGWGQPVGILRPKGWESCLKFARYTKEEGYKGVALVRVWKSTCEPGMLAGSATERYRLMCVSLGYAVEKYATKPDWTVEDICDSVLSTFHDTVAVDTPFDR